MNKPTIEFCEDKFDNLGTYNVFSNLFIIFAGFYGLLQLNRINIDIININRKNINLFYLTEFGIINVGLGSMYFHYKKNYFSQLFDELPMSILIILYVLLVNKNNNKKISLGIILFTIIGWIIYLYKRKFIIFETVFTIQIIFLIVLLFINYKTIRQLKLIIIAILVLGFSKLLWNYEQYLVKTEQCPYNNYSLKYYLHSYWHIGISISHIVLMLSLRYFYNFFLL